MLVDIKKFIGNVDKKTFAFYLFFTLLLLVTLIVLSTVKFTQARYESNAEVNFTPSIAFFIVDVESVSGQIRLEEMIPRAQPYTYVFEVSNFNDEKRANVDLTYSIEIITTTNMPLKFKVYKGINSTQDIISSSTFTTDDNGVYYRHLVINDVSTMTYSANHTDTYVLSVEFPIASIQSPLPSPTPTPYNHNPDAYAGIIDLVDIKINAEQVV